MAGTWLLLPLPPVCAVLALPRGCRSQPLPSGSNCRSGQQRRLCLFRHLLLRHISPRRTLHASPAATGRCLAAAVVTSHPSHSRSHSWHGFRELGFWGDGDGQRREQQTNRVGARVKNGRSKAPPPFSIKFCFSFILLLFLLIILNQNSQQYIINKA